MERRIDVMIIGAQKAGTTSLLRYLGEHPQCISHPQKEFSYFTDKKEYLLGLNTTLKKYYAHQNHDKSTKLIAKNAGIFTDISALSRLKQNNPNCELIFILRNPVERTYSSYLMEKNFGTLNFDFTELPKLIRKHQNNENDRWDFDFFIEYSLYSTHLKNIYNYFPKTQVKIILYEDFKNDTLGICKNIFSLINVDDSFIPNIDVKHNVTIKTRSNIYARVVKHILHNENPLKKLVKKILPGHTLYKYGELIRDVNKTEKKHLPINEDVKKFLIQYFKPFNVELEKMIGKDLGNWDL